MQKSMKITKDTSGKEGSVTVMEEREKKILENFAVLIPKLSEADKSYLLGLGEGMMIKIEMPKKEMMKTTA